MFTYPETSPENTSSSEVGPSPYFHRSDCNICRKQDGLPTGSALLDHPPVGGYIVETEHFLAEHAPLQASSAGTVIVEARRHLLDFGDMAQGENADLGSILRRLVPAIKVATGVERVYYLALMEKVGHFHLWLVPKKGDGDPRGVEYMAQQPPLTATQAEAEKMVGQIRTAYERS
jgi:diadenosine tetraphosphate (Ap4A) HIT family hydrolase